MPMSADVQSLRIEEFDYPLPDSRIAAHPLEKRDECLLLVRTPDGSLSRHIFKELPALLPSGAMLVYNNTRVINARLRFRKDAQPDAREGALIEVFVLEPLAPADYAQAFASQRQCTWICFVGNSKRWKDQPLHMPVQLADGRVITLTAIRVEKMQGSSAVEFSWDADAGVSFSQIIEAVGEIPIPPYLNRATEQSDSSDYQTVYSRIEGSVAAPTAGLHFTPEVLAAVDKAGIERRELTLHVGAGTFQPVKSDTIGGHGMHSEFISVGRSLIAELAATSRPVIAVGTTSVRTLESLYHIGCLISEGRWQGEVPQWYPYEDEHPRLSRGEALTRVVEWLDTHAADRLVASTRIIIAPGYRYMIVGGMVTNFHQPQSTLLLLVSAFTGGGNEWRRMYDYALDADFRFLSYGDACLLL